MLNYAKATGNAREKEAQAVEYSIVGLRSTITPKVIGFYAIIATPPEAQDHAQYMNNDSSKYHM